MSSLFWKTSTATLRSLQNYRGNPAFAVATSCKIWSGPCLGEKACRFGCLTSFVPRQYRVHRRFGADIGCSPISGFFMQQRFGQIGESHGLKHCLMRPGQAALRGVRPMQPPASGQPSKPTSPAPKSGPRPINFAGQKPVATGQPQPGRSPITFAKPSAAAPSHPASLPTLKTSLPSNSSLTRGADSPAADVAADGTPDAAVVFSKPGAGVLSAGALPSSTPPSSMAAVAAETSLPVSPRSNARGRRSEARAADRLKAGAVQQDAVHGAQSTAGGSPQSRLNAHAELRERLARAQLLQEERRWALIAHGAPEEMTTTN